jgi:hypothetical protein
MTSRLALLPAVVLASLLIAACGDETATTGASAAPSTDLEQAEVLWAEEGPASYTMTLESSCGERSGLGIFEVSVTPGTAEARPVKGTHDESIVTTVEDLFAFVEESDALGAEVVDVTYDSVFGFPNSVEVDHRVDAIDDEACYRVEDFTAGTE